MPTELSPVETQELRRHEAVIEQGLNTFLEVGTALLAIRDGRLYRGSHETFEDYCRQRWDFSRSHAYRMIDVARVIEDLSPIGDKHDPDSHSRQDREDFPKEIPLPTTESQVRPLVPLPREERQGVWIEAVEAAPDGKPTARDVQRVIERRSAPRFSGRIEDDLPAYEDESQDIPDPDFEAGSESTEEPEAEVDPDAGWSASELERRDQVMLRGLTVLANQRCDPNLIEWARREGRYVPIDRTAYPLGNPLRLDDSHGRADVIAWYRDHWLPFHHDRITWDDLQAKVLGCWCYPDPCHGDVIIENLSNEDAGHEVD